MSELSCASEIIKFPDQTEIVRLSFAGRYPPGSQGNAVAALIFDFIIEARKRHAPRALILDFAELDDVCADSIAGMLMAIKRQDRTRDLDCPTCLVATGQTARSLHHLFTTFGFKYLLNTEIVADVEQATRYLRSD